jgi:zinc transport system ATP-binding protein
MSSVVDVRHLAVGYDGREILHDVSLAVPGGEVVAILGANGSGKSTLIRTILGLVPIERGDIDLFGTPQKRFRDWARVGYVPQRLGAGSGVPATVGEVVASGRLARRGIFRPPGGADKAAVREAFAAALGEFATGGGTILLVAHELGPLRPLIDRAVVVHEGRIAHEGVPPEPAGHHALPGHDHVHPHAAPEKDKICVSPTDRITARS